MITLRIEHEDGDRVINLGANTMRELIDEKLPRYLPKLKDDLPLLKTTKRFKENPKEAE